MTRTDLLAMAERVEQGSGLDVWLWLSIARATEPTPERANLLTSLDAVEALRERLLPGSRVEIIQDAEGRWGAAVRRDLVDPCHGESLASEEPRARLAALLRACAETAGG